MRATHAEFALVSLLIMSLQVGALLGQDQPIEVGVEMPGFVIRQGIFHGEIQFIFKGDSIEELSLISLRIYSQNGTLSEMIFPGSLWSVGAGSDTYGMVDLYPMERLVFIEAIYVSVTFT